MTIEGRPSPFHLIRHALTIPYRTDALTSYPVRLEGSRLKGTEVLQRNADMSPSPRVRKRGGMRPLSFKRHRLTPAHDLNVECLAGFE